MASQLTVPGFIVKWIVIPAMLATVGYMLIGPRIGKGDVQPTIQGSAEPSTPVQGNPTASSMPSSTNDDPSVVSEKPRTSKHVRHKKKRSARPVDSVSVSSENFPQSPSTEVGETGSESATSH